MPKFVVIISDSGEISGGAPKIAITTARGLADRGLNVIFVSAGDTYDQRLTHPNITIASLNLENVWAIQNPARAAIDGAWNTKAAIRLSLLLGPLDPVETIIHLHSWTKALSPSVINIVSKLAFPWVVTFHDYFFICPNGSYFNHSAVLPCTLKPMSLSCMISNCDSHSYAHKAIRLIRHSLLQRVLRNSQEPLNVIHISHFAKTIAGRFLPKDTRNFLVTNPNESEKSPPVRVTDNVDFVFIGRFQQEKGCILFARAARSLGVPATFLGAGRDADAILRCYSHAKIIHWAGQEVIGNVLERARALVFPSRWYETGGLVVLEALARGVPVVASDMTGARDFIQDNVNGLLFKMNDEAHLVECMRQLLDIEIAGRMGLSAYKMYWDKPPTLQVYLDSLTDVYEKIFSEHRKRTAGQNTEVIAKKV